MPANDHSLSNKRSRSPQRDRGALRDAKRQRSYSPHRHRHSSSNHQPKAKLPFKSAHLHKHDFPSHRALFAHYLDIQKQLDIEDLNEDEVKGRWKSFLGKWNRRELAEGWYDPETKQKADERAVQPDPRPHFPKKPDVLPSRRKTDSLGDEDENEDDSYGPSLPDTGRMKSGPTVPKFQDLQHRRELEDEDRQGARADLRYKRKQDRAVQKARLEELVPRADPGSRERQLEKKRDAAVSNKTFAEAREAGTEEVGDGDLMGDDGLEGLKARRKQVERQKNERELRKEEVLRARAAEREEKMSELRKKEDKTMEMLRDLAQQRYGGQS